MCFSDYKSVFVNLYLFLIRFSVRILGFRKFAVEQGNAAKSGKKKTKKPKRKNEKNQKKTKEKKKQKKKNKRKEK